MAGASGKSLETSKTQREVEYSVYGPKVGEIFKVPLMSWS